MVVLSSDVKDILWRLDGENKVSSKSNPSEESITAKTAAAANNFGVDPPLYMMLVNLLSPPQPQPTDR